MNLTRNGQDFVIKLLAWMKETKDDLPKSKRTPHVHGLSQYILLEYAYYPEEFTVFTKFL